MIFVGSCSSSPFGGTSQDVIERGYLRSILFDLLVHRGLKGAYNSVENGLPLW